MLAIPPETSTVCPMDDVLVLSGANEYGVEQALAAHLDGGDVEVIDFASGGDLNVALQAVGSLSLFGGGRHVALRSVDILEVGNVETLAAALETTTARVAITVRARSKAANLLEKRFGLTTFSKLKVKDVPTAVREISSRYGVSAPTAVARMFAERSDGDLWRVDSFFRALAAAGIQELSVDTACLLFADTSGGPTPWEIGDALADRRIFDAFRLAERVDPYAFAAWADSQLRQALTCVEAGATTPGDAARALGQPAWMAARAATWARCGDALYGVHEDIFRIQIEMRSTTTASIDALVVKLVATLACALRS